MIHSILRWRVPLAVLLLAVIGVGVGVLLVRPFAENPPAGAQEIALPLATPSGDPSPEAATLPPTATALAPPTAPSPAVIKVYISGAVANPGVYTLAEGDRVEDAVRMAGGALADADLDQLNLAARLRDEQQVRVPRWGEATATPGPAAPPDVPVAPTTAAAAAPSGPARPAAPVNINTADAAALDTLPGIGPALAGRIIAYRTANGPFARPADIMAVKGIGDSIFAAIAPFITVGP